MRLREANSNRVPPHRVRADRRGRTAALPSCDPMPRVGGSLGHNAGCFWGFRGKGLIRLSRFLALLGALVLVGCAGVHERDGVSASLPDADPVAAALGR